MYYRDNVVEKINLSLVLKTTESVCSALGIKLGKLQEAYVTELPKFPTKSLYAEYMENTTETPFYYLFSSLLSMVHCMKCTCRQKVIFTNTPLNIY